MIRDTLQTLNDQSDRYGAHLWTHRVSGNTLDLSVHPKHRSEPAKYRGAVIYAGQVLQAISQEAIDQGQSIMIQSFPNLGEPELIAHVRWFSARKSSNHDESESLHSGLLSLQPFDNILRSTASHFGMFVLELDMQDPAISPELVSIYPGNGSDTHFRVLCTLSDNPFDWLKTGQWIERFLQLKQSDPGLPDADFYRFDDREIRTTVHQQLEHHPYPQVLVSYQPCDLG